MRDIGLEISHVVVVMKAEDKIIKREVVEREALCAE